MTESKKTTKAAKKTAATEPKADEKKADEAKEKKADESPAVDPTLSAAFTTPTADSLNPAFASAKDEGKDA